MTQPTDSTTDDSPTLAPETAEAPMASEPRSKGKREVDHGMKVALKSTAKAARSLADVLDKLAKRAGS